MNVPAVTVTNASLLMLGVLFTCNISSTLAQPCQNNGHAVLGTGKQIFKQSNHCTIIENNNIPTTCPPDSTLQNGVCVPTTGGSAPVANAGPDQTVVQGNTVTLDGSGSFARTSGATIVSYSWTQTSAPFVTIKGANTATPNFVAPTVSTTISLTFSLTVTDSNGLVSAPSSVTITVTPS